MGLGEPIAGRVTEVLGGLLGDFHGTLLCRLTGNLIACIGSYQLTAIQFAISSM